MPERFRVAMHGPPNAATGTAEKTRLSDALGAVPGAEERAAVVRAGEHELLLLPGMHATLRALFRDAGEARRRLLVETYIYRDGLLGAAFADCLEQAVRRGAQTRLLYDPLGSELASPAFFAGLARRGVHARPYRPSHVVASTLRYFPRDHSRIVVADDAAYTGGAAWGDEWLPRSLGGKGWHDVCLRVAGPVADAFAAVFESRWTEAADGSKPVEAASGPRYAELELLADTPGGESLLYSRFRAAVRRARRRVWIENAYFFPPAALRRELYDAAARGVDVQIIVPGSSDLPIVRRAARADYEEWLSRGLSIWEYQPAMLHSKVALVDDDWATVGTFNLNAMALRATNELAVIVRAPAFAFELARMLERDRERSRVVEPGRSRGLPPLTRMADRLAAGCLWLVEAWPTMRLRGRGERDEEAPEET